MISMSTWLQRLLRQSVFGIAIVLAALYVTPAWALPADFAVENAVTGLNKVVNLRTLPDATGRMLVLQQNGEIYIFDPADQPPVATLFLALSDIEDEFEQGLASLALHPDFVNNGLFYIYYTKASLNKNVVSEFVSLGNTADPASETVIWQDNEVIQGPSDPLCDNPNISDGNTRRNHFGGGLAFGPDGKLYIATGEEFDECQAQDLTRAGGKLIRINSDGSIPADNPYATAGGGILPEIYAYGLRNPYRMHYDLVKNKLYIGEVGGNVQATATEDLHLGAEDVNYGWPDCEGFTCDPGGPFDAPLYSYGHDPGAQGGLGGAITAGTVYRGAQYPSEFAEAFFFGDYALGFIKYLKFDASGNVIDDTGTPDPSFAFDFAVPGIDNVGTPVAIELGSDGALYIADYTLGTVKRIVYNDPTGNQAPVITSTTPDTATNIALNGTINFSATATDDGGAGALTYEWFFGDGESAIGQNVSHTYDTLGVFNAYVLVTDAPATGSPRSSFSEVIPIEVGTPPAITSFDVFICDPADTGCAAANPTRSLFFTGDEIEFAATATAADGTALIEWDILFLHLSHVHPMFSDLEVGSGTLDTGNPPHDYHDFSGYEFTVTVTDTVNGISRSSSTVVLADIVDLTLDAEDDLGNPLANIPISIDGVAQNSPVPAFNTAVNFDHFISAPDAICLDGTLQVFDSWSDGGGSSHLVNIPASNLSLVATYTAGGACEGSVPPSGLVGHFEGDAGVTAAGGIVSAWADQSPEGNDLTALGNPQVIAGVLSGNPVIDFDGVDDALLRTGTLNNFPAGSDNRTVYFVANYRGVGTGGVSWGKKKQNQVFGVVVDGSGNLEIQGWGSANDFPTSEPGTGADWMSQSAELTGNTLRHFKDGALIDTRVHVFNTGSDELRVAARIGGSPQVDMQVAAIFIYNRALNSFEKGQLEDYIDGKYFSGSGGNSPPNALPDSDAVAALGSVAIDVLANDSDPNGDALDETSVLLTDPALPLHGTATADPVTGIVTYTHTGGGTGSDSFKYTVADEFGLPSSEATVTVTIGNAPPVANDDSATTDVATAVIVDVAANDTDDGQLNLGSVAVVAGPSAGQLSNIAGGNVTYTPNLGASPGTDTFTYTIDDNDGETSNVATVTVTVTAVGVNDPPVANDDSATTDVVTAVVIDVAANDTDDNDQLNLGSVVVVSGPSTGQLSNIAGGNVTYTPNLGASPGTDTFTYTIDDDDGETSNVATVTVTVADIASGELPTANLVLHLESDTGVTVDFGAVVTNWNDQSGLGNHLSKSGDPLLVDNVFGSQPGIDFDGAGDNLERIAANDAIAGLPAGNADRSMYIVVNYDAATGNGGAGYGRNRQNKAFALAVKKGSSNLMMQGWGAANDFQASVIGPGAGPMIQSVVLTAGQMAHFKDGVLLDTQTHAYNTEINRIVAGSELDGDPGVDMQLGAMLVYDVAHTPAQRQAVHDFLTAKYFSTTSSNDPPVANADSATTDVATSVVIDVAANDTDDNDQLNLGSVVVVSGPSAGQLSNIAGGNVTYTPNLGASPGTDTFTYTIDDDDGETSNVATVTVTVTAAGVNDPPVANDDSATTDVATAVVIDVAANDTDDNDQLNLGSVVVVSGPSAGQLSNIAGGNVTYTPNLSASPGTDTFTYTIDDDDGVTSNVASVTVTVNDVSSGGLPTANLVLHLESDVGVTLNFGTVVTDWADQSGQGNDLGKSGDPQLVQNVFGSQPGIDFDGVADNLERLADINGLPAGNAERTMYSVVSYDAATGNGGAAYGRNRQNKAFGITVKKGSAALTVQGWGTDNDFQSGVTGPGAGAMIQSAIFGSGQLEHFKDGVSIDTQTHAFNTEVNFIVVGGELDGDPGVDMQVGAVLIYDVAHDAAQQAQVLAYLNDKYFGIGGGNPLPVANDDSATTEADTTVVIAVAANDTDNTNVVAASVDIVDAPSAGGVANNGDGTITYDALGVAPGVYTFTYTIDDDEGATSIPGTVSVTVTSANVPPTALNDSASTFVDTAVVINVVSNDNDPEGFLDAASLAIVTAPGSGALALNTPADGMITYTPSEGTVAGTDTFVYNVADTSGAPSNNATVTITLSAGGGTGMLPTTGLVLHVESDFGLTITGGCGGVNCNVIRWEDQSPEGNDLRKSGDPQLAQNVFDDQPGIRFPEPGDNLKRFETDSGGITGFPSGNDNRSVYVVINYLSADNGGFAFGRAGGGGNRAFGLIANDSGNFEIEGFGAGNDFPTSTTAVGLGPVIQSAVLNNSTLEHYVDGVLIDTQTHVFNTEVQRIMLGAELDGAPTVDIEIGAVLVYNVAHGAAAQADVLSYLNNKYFAEAGGPGTPPVANNDSATVAEDSVVTIDLTANDTDADGIVDSTVVVSGGNGLITNNGNGTVLYNPNGTLAGTDTFTYTVEDTLGEISNTATVTVAITPAGTASLPSANLVLHLESDSGVTTNGSGIVTLWEDQSPENNDLNSSSGNPTVAASVFNGQPAIDFDGNGDRLERLSAIANMPSGADDRSAYIVANYQSVGDGGFAWGTSGRNKVFTLGVDAATGNLEIKGWGGANDYTSSEPGNGAGSLVQSVIVDGGVFEHYNGDVLIDTDTHNFNTNVQKIVVGSDIDNAPDIDMQVGAIIVYDRALSPAEHQDVLDYLEQKYLGN